MAQEHTIFPLYLTWPPSYTTIFQKHYFQPKPLSSFSSTHSIPPLSHPLGLLTGPSHSEIQKWISYILPYPTAPASLTVSLVLFLGVRYHCLPSQLIQTSQTFLYMHIETENEFHRFTSLTRFSPRFTFPNSHPVKLTTLLYVFSSLIGRIWLDSKFLEGRNIFQIIYLVCWMNGKNEY